MAGAGAGGPGDHPRRGAPEAAEGPGSVGLATYLHFQKKTVLLLDSPVIVPYDLSMSAHSLAETYVSFGELMRLARGSFKRAIDAGAGRVACGHCPSNAPCTTVDMTRGQPEADRRAERMPRWVLRVLAVLRLRLVSRGPGRLQRRPRPSACRRSQ